ncbi:MAG: AraC family transcriptional regulator, partial [Candidatus Faecousia sp.]|nr:AraC family transcriptional regulator [Candidatus Faecousia sp.]
EAIYRVPSSQYTIVSRNLRMLHYCVTGQRIEISDVFVDDIQTLSAAKHRRPTDRHRVYSAEKAMLEMVRLGDLNYQEALSASMNISDGVKINANDPMRHARVSTVVFCTIVCRAAIEGGLSPEEAYSLGDAYIQSALDAHTIDELSTICISMYDDFVRRVHRIRENPKYSEPIRRCCNYIEMNLDRNIRAQELADLIGYSVTYFTRRFRAETGFGISDYVKAARIERARILLETSDSSVQEISDKLGFTSRNYFTRCFREVTGRTPTEYRNTK